MKLSSTKSQDFFVSVDETLEYVLQKLLTRPAEARQYISSESLNDYVSVTIKQFQTKAVSVSSPLNIALSPSLSSKAGIEIEDWFENALTLSWKDVVWPRLEKRGWRLFSENSAPGTTQSIVFLMPGVKLDEVSFGKNAFSSEDDVRRYLLVLYTQWSQLWKQRGSSSSKSKTSPEAPAKVPSKAKVDTR